MPVLEGVLTGAIGKMAGGSGGSGESDDGKGQLG